MLFTINSIRSTLWGICLIVSDCVFTLLSRRIVVPHSECSASLLGLSAVFYFFAKGRRLVWLPSSARPPASAGLSLLFRIFCIVSGSVCGYCIFSPRERELVWLHSSAQQTCVPSEGLWLFFSILCIIIGSRCGYCFFSPREGGLVYRSSVSACSPYIPNASEPITLFLSAFGAVLSIFSVICGSSLPSSD